MRSPLSSRAASSCPPSPRLICRRRRPSPWPWQDAPACFPSSRSSMKSASRPSRRRAARTARSWALSPRSYRRLQACPPLPRQRKRAQTGKRGTMPARMPPRLRPQRHAIFPLLPARDTCDGAICYCAAPEATVQVMVAAFWGAEMSAVTRAIFASVMSREIVSFAEVA